MVNCIEMTIAFTIFLICIPIFIFVTIFYLVSKNQKERELIEQVTPLTRGEWAERRLVLSLLQEGVNPKAIFHDLYIQKSNGEYAQIDVVVATRVGIIVFEVKDYSGWIFGNEHQKYWTQLLAYGKEKHRFYNPIMQNSGHIQTIRQSLPHNPDIPIYSVIIFYGNSELKDVTCQADNTCVIYPEHISQVLSEIMMQPDANFGNKQEIMDLFTRAVQNGNDQMIVSSQINTAVYYGRNAPQSSYSTYFNPFYPLRRGRFSRRRRFW